jgi:hypothetical protein
MMCARRALIVRLRTHRAGRLGRQHDVGARHAEVLQRLADDALGLAERVDVRGIDEVDAARQRAFDQPVRVVLADGADRRPHAGVRIAAERHRAETQLGDVQARAAQLLVFHPGSFPVRQHRMRRRAPHASRAGCEFSRSARARAPLRSDGRDALAVAARGLEIARRHFVGRRIGRRLRHRRKIRAHAIQVVALRRLQVRRLEVHADPEAAVLARQQHEVLERVQLVAVDARAVGEAAEQLVAPRAFEPRLRRGVGEFLELPAGAAHVGRRAEQDRVGRGKRAPRVVGDVSVGVDRDQHGARAVGDGLCHPFGMAVAGVVDDDRAGRGGSRLRHG